MNEDDNKKEQEEQEQDVSKGYRANIWPDGWDRVEAPEEIEPNYGTMRPC